MVRKGTKVKIISLDNDSYIGWFERELTVTHASNKDSPFYDTACYPEKLCELKDASTGEVCPNALYEWELERILKSRKKN